MSTCFISKACQSNLTELQKYLNLVQYQKVIFKKNNHLQKSINISIIFHLEYIFGIELLIWGYT